MKRLFPLFSLILSLLALVLLDLVIGLAAPYNRPSTPRNKDVFVVSSPTMIHQLIPNATFTYDGVLYHTNNIGFRDRAFSIPKPSGNLRVAVLGDSFIEGMGENQENTIPKLMEPYLSKTLGKPVEVMNCGVRGGSPAVYRFWTKRILDYSPDAVVLCVFSNDMDDDACALLTKARYRAEAWYESSPWVRKSNIMSYLVGEIAAFKFKRHRREISQNLFGQDDFHRDQKRVDHNENAIGSNGYGYMDDPNGWKEHWDRTQQNLDLIIADLNVRKVPALVVFIPSNMIMTKPDPFGGWVEDWGRRRKVSVLNLVPAIQAWNHLGYPTLYQATFSHFNPLGLEKASNWIAKSLSKILATPQI